MLIFAVKIIDNRFLKVLPKKTDSIFIKQHKCFNIAITNTNNMKKIITTIAAVAISTLTFAQLVPNGSFETATGNNADGWVSLSGRTKVRTTLSIPANGSTFSITASTGTNFLGVLNDTVNGALRIGRVNTTMVMKRRPAGFKFKMNYLTSVTTESFFAFVTFFQSNDGRRDTLLTDFVALSQRGPLLGSVTGNKIGWLQISKPINYDYWDNNFLNAISDSCTIEFFSSGNMASGTSSSSFSTELLLDDVEFTTWGTGLETTVTAVDQPLLSNYPNPFASSTVINYSLAIPSENVNLTVVDINGKQVFTQNLGKQNAGEITLDFDGSDLKEGIYFYTVTSDNNRQTGKMMISK